MSAKRPRMTQAVQASARAISLAVPLLLFDGSAARAGESHAKEILKAMSDYLAAQERFSFEYDSTLEVVTKEDQKLQLASSGTAAIERPNRIRSTRSSGFVDVEIIFDGSTLTLFGKNANAYTQVRIEGSIDHLVEELRYTYGRPLPAADLLLSQPYAELMKDVTDIKDLGSGVIGGQECDFLAFRTEEVDWQIWVAHGDAPYPCRYVITSKDIPGAPQYSIQLRNWSTDAADVDFSFQPSADARKIELEDLQTKIRELPEHFKMGEAQ